MQKEEDNVALYEKTVRIVAAMTILDRLFS